MSGDLVIPAATNGVTVERTAAACEAGAEDPWETAFRPVKPTLDAVVELWKSLAWLERQRHARQPLFDPKRAAEVIETIPGAYRLAKAGALFRDAVEQSAPEWWVHPVIGLMLNSTRSAQSIDGDAVRCAITDSMFRDPEVWEGHRPGFSAAVIARAIREARRTCDDAPSTAAFLKLCAQHRARFRQWSKDTGVLLQLRYDAEDHIEKLGGAPAQLTYVDDEADIPF
jgi:hypothetical protein